MIRSDCLSRLWQRPSELESAHSELHLAVMEQLPEMHLLIIMASLIMTIQVRRRLLFNDTPMLHEMQTKARAGVGTAGVLSTSLAGHDIIDNCLSTPTSSLIALRLSPSLPKSPSSSPFPSWYCCCQSSSGPTTLTVEFAPHHQLRSHSAASRSMPMTSTAMSTAYQEAN